MFHVAPFHMKHAEIAISCENTSVDKKKTGYIGEEAVANHLRRHGFDIIDRNYLKKWGEIDVIARKGGLVHFVEVKTVSREIEASEGTSVARGTGYRPEENVHPSKLKKLHRAIQTWLEERNYDGDWQIDVAAVYLDAKNKRGVVKIIDNVILE